LGHVWFPSSGDLENLTTNQTLYHRALAEYGNPVPPEFPIGTWVCLAEDRQQALSEGHRYLGAQHDEAEFQVMARTRLIVGTPEDCSERVKEYRERLGATHLICRVQAPGMTQDQVLRTIRLLGERVLPRFKD